MSRQSEDWQGDLESRQRNVVFPDSLRNETNFLRALFSGMPLTPIQRLGAAILGVVWVIVAGLMLTSSLLGFRQVVPEDGQILGIVQVLPTIAGAVLMFALSVASLAAAIFAPQKRRAKLARNDHQHPTRY